MIDQKQIQLARLHAEFNSLSQRELQIAECAAMLERQIWEAKLESERRINSQLHERISSLLDHHVDAALQYGGDQ